MIENSHIPLSPPGADRRAALRYPCRPDRACQLVVSDRTTARWARPRDISLTGIGLSVSGPFAPGSLALLEFSARREGPALRLLGQIMYAVPQSDGSWAVGCRFDSLRGDLDAAERAQVLEHFRAPADTQTGQDRLPAGLTVKLHTPLPPLLQALKRRTGGTGAGPIEDADVGPAPLEQLFDLLLLARGRLRLQRARLELSEPLVRALEASPGFARGRGRRCTSLFPMETLYVHADAERLTWACASLLALVARQVQGEGSLWLAAERHERMGVLRIGGPAPTLSEVPLPTFGDILAGANEACADAEQRDQVCLALVRGLIELHGGTVERRTARAGACAEYVVRLPLLTDL